MATAVYTTEEVTLQDDTEVTLKPLVIGRLRKVMAMMNEFEKAETEDDTILVILNAAAFCLSKQHPEYWDEKEKKASEKFSEEAIDMPTAHKILEVCAGIKLNDPNLLAATAELLGQNSTS